MEGSIATDVILPVSLAIIMLGMGLSLTINDFRNILNYPKAAILGLTNQLLVLPIIGFALAIVFKLSPEMAVGLMILAACPGGATSNLIAHVAKGDTALSITLTAISSTITVFTIPLIVSYALKYFYSDSDIVIQLPVLRTIIQIMGVTIVPVSIGMIIKKIKNDFAIKMEKPVRIASTVIFILVVVGIVAGQKDNIIPYFKSIGLVTILLNISTMAIGYLTARLLSLNLNQTISISIESGVQNGVLAIVIATSILHQPDMAIPPAVYSLVMLFTGGFMMSYFGNRKEVESV